MFPLRELKMVENCDHAIFEPLERGFYGPINLLRSRSYPHLRCYVRFVNHSNSVVRVYWIDFDGKAKHFKTLSRGQYVDCNTFEDHVWVFRDDRTKDPLCVGNKEVYRAVPHFQGNVIHPCRGIVLIHRPMKSLRFLAACAVREQLKLPFQPFFLELPFNLQVMLAKMLVEKLDCIHRLETSNLFDNDIIVQHCNRILHDIGILCRLVSRYAQELRSNTEGSGEVHHIIKDTLTAISDSMLYTAVDKNVIKIPVRELGPHIWRQILYTRMLQDAIRSHNLNYSGSKEFLHEIQRRVDTMPVTQRSTLQRYHWEQLGKLLGYEWHNPDCDKDAYDIPEITQQNLPHKTFGLNWISCVQDAVSCTGPGQRVYYEVLIKNIFLDLEKVESVFQLFCIFHKYLTGLDVSQIEEPQDIECEEPIP